MIRNYCNFANSWKCKHMHSLGCYQLFRGCFLLQKLKRICVLILSAFMILGCLFSSYADVRDLLIGSDSNASTFALPRSSIANVTNTINPAGVMINFAYNSGAVGRSYLDSDGSFSYIVPSGATVNRMQVYLYPNNMPYGGTYRNQFDFTSHSSLEYNQMRLYARKNYTNAAAEINWYDLYPYSVDVSGDCYIDFVVDVPSGLTYYCYDLWFEDVQAGGAIGGWIDVNFTRTSEAPEIIVSSSASGSSSNEEYQQGISSSLSDLSSSVGEVSDEIGFVAEAIQNLQGAMEPHYNNVLTQLHHITEQLHAFYDQVYNNIHLAQMNMLSQIKEAIENIDLEVNISLDGLKQTIQQVGQNVITNDNKISADQIANDEANTEEVKDAVKEHGNFIIDGLKGLFIPSDEFFKAYFDDLYAYFSDRFGFLSFPIDLVIRIADLFLTSEKVDAVLTLPSFEISGYKVWEDYSFNFTEFLETSFPFLISAIQTVTSIGLIMAFVNLCQDKWNEVMRS